jgi:hypothetical protein
MTDANTQWTAEDLRGKTSEQIDAARLAGLLDDLVDNRSRLEIIRAIREEAQWTRDDLRGKTTAQIEAARLAGKLDTLMNVEAD